MDLHMYVASGSRSLSNAGLDYDDYSAKRIRFGEVDGGVEELPLFQA